MKDIREIARMGDPADGRIVEQSLNLSGNYERGDGYRLVLGQRVPVK